jgi:hypothetical protein
LADGERRAADHHDGPGRRTDGRFDGICDAAGVALADLDIQAITAPTLRLDLEARS